MTTGDTTQDTPHDATHLRRGRAVPTWLRLARVFSKIDRSSVEQLRAFGLTVAQFDVLAHVGSAEGITQQELAHHLLVTKGNVTQLVDRMEHCGLLVRRQEGRANRLFLTEAGRKLFAEVVPAHEAHIARQFAALAPEELAELHRLLRALDRSLE
jgi:DNA-binding MarR family transcriptional regulator